MNPNPALRAVLFCSLTLAPLAGQAYTISGQLVSVVGTNGNPAIQSPTISPTTFGLFTTKPITGTTNNTASSQVDISSSPSLSLSATGTDPSGGNAAYGFAQASLTYSFSVIGPAGAQVPVIFSGTSSGAINQSGNALVLNGEAGTRMTLFAPSLGLTFKDNGSTGTPGDIGPLFQSGNDNMRIGWGNQASSPVNYTSYSAAYDYEAIIAAGSAGSIKLEGLVQGGLFGSLRPTGTLTTGISTAFIDPYISIDPAWLALHPGYSIQVEAGIGNAPASVPLPASVWLFGSVLLGVAGLRRQA